MSRYIAIDGCKKCPHRHYYSAGAYECLKYGTVLPASHILDIPDWCPLPKLPTPASAQETSVAPVRTFTRVGQEIGMSSMCECGATFAKHIAQDHAGNSCVCPTANRGESL